MNKKVKLGINLILAVVCIAIIYILSVTQESTAMIFVVLKKTAVYGLVAVSMNLLNGFTGLFSLGQAGFMLLGSYTYAALTIPAADRGSVYQYFDGGWIQFALPVAVAIILAGIVAAIFAWLIGMPVLRLKSDYLAIATLGFAEILRAFCQWDVLGPLTNGSNMLRKFPNFDSIVNGWGETVPFIADHAVFFSTMLPIAIAAVCIAVIVLMLKSTYGRAFVAIRDDEVAAEAMGIKLSYHKMISFCTSAFFAGIGGALLAMYMTTVQASAFKSAMTYEILLIVVIGGIGSISGSVLASFLFVACSEWWLRFLDAEKIVEPQLKTTYIVVASLVILAVVAYNWFKARKAEKKEKTKVWTISGVVGACCLAMVAGWAFSDSLQVPFLRNGFRLVVFSIIIMVVVLFYRQGIMGNKELDVERLYNWFKGLKNSKKDGESHG
ncbi:MAG: branched-chain amino acid ABC transporter permease [Eubacteriales bacterium]